MWSVLFLHEPFVHLVLFMMCCTWGWVTTEVESDRAGNLQLQRRGRIASGGVLGDVLGVRLGIASLIVSSMDAKNTLMIIFATGCFKRRRNLRLISVTSAPEWIHLPPPPPGSFFPPHIFHSSSYFQSSSPACLSLSGLLVLVKRHTFE